MLKKLLKKLGRVPSGYTKVLMVNSVDDLPAGTHQVLPAAQADTFILRGYATGDLAAQDENERTRLRGSGHQTVGIGHDPRSY